MKVEFKPLDRLEERVKKAVEAVRKLEEENQGLRQKLGDLETRLRTEEQASREIKSLRDSNSKTEKELEALQREREDVRRRVENLLGELDRLKLD